MIFLKKYRVRDIIWVVKINQNEVIYDENGFIESN